MYERLIEDINLRRLSVRRPIFTTPPQMARCCLFWFSLPGPCITFCVCQRYGHNIYLYMLLHTPSIIFATHYLSLIWAQEKPLIFWQYFTCLFWFSLPGPCITFCVCQRYGHNIYLYMLLHTPSIIFATHYLSLIWAQEKPLIFWQYFTCLFWFCLPTHLDHLCPCCRHGHNINIQIFLYTPCIILTTHYLPRIWTPKKLLIFWQHVD